MLLWWTTNKTTTTITDKNNLTVDFLLVEYHFQGESHPINVTKHGNSKLKSPFQPTSASTQKILTEKIKGSMAGASQVYNTVFEKFGGLENAEAISDFPRKYKQIKCVLNKIRKTNRQDVIAELLSLVSEKNSCISNLQFNPETRFVVTPTKTINDFVEFSNDLLKPISSLVID